LWGISTDRIRHVKLAFTPLEGTRERERTKIRRSSAHQTWLWFCDVSPRTEHREHTHFS